MVHSDTSWEKAFLLYSFLISTNSVAPRSSSCSLRGNSNGSQSKTWRKAAAVRPGLEEESQKRPKGLWRKEEHEESQRGGMRSNFRGRAETSSTIFGILCLAWVSHNKTLSANGLGLPQPHSWHWGWHIRVTLGWLYANPYSQEGGVCCPSLPSMCWPPSLLHLALLLQQQLGRKLRSFDNRFVTPGEAFWLTLLA